MFSTGSFPLLVSSYSAVIFLVMYLSGYDSVKSMYDGHLVTLRAVELSATDPELSRQFFSNIVGLAVAQKGNEAERTRLVLPDGTHLLLHRREAGPDADPPMLFAGVRNNLKKLHRSIVRRSGKAPYQISAGIRGRSLPPGRVSELFALGDQKAFAVSDPDGNVIIFYTAGSRESLPEWR